MIKSNFFAAVRRGKSCILDDAIPERLPISSITPDPLSRLESKSKDLGDLDD